MTTTQGTSCDPNLERDIQEIGRRLLDRARHRRGNSWLAGGPDALLNRLMDDSALRVRMLRFVDVLPALADDRELTRHLEEYLGDLPLPLSDLPLVRNFPALGQWVLRQGRSALGATILAAGVRAVANRLAGRFIPGDDVPNVAHGLRTLHRDGCAFTLDLLGEATVSDAEAVAYQQRYLQLLDELAPRVASWPAQKALETVSGRPAPRLNLSIKVSALNSQLDPIDPAGSAEAIKRRLRPILQAARARGAFINLDMEQYDAKEITLRLFCELLSEPALRDWPDAGIAMQAYLRDTPADLAALIDWAKARSTPVTVRLVRGAYWDYETVIARQHGWPIPVWTHKHQTDACYEQCVRLLLENHPHVEAAIATHNVRSLALAMGLARRLGLDPTQYEFQMLYGMAEPLKDALLRQGQRLRIYVPFGRLIPGMAYLVRRLLENSSNQSFLRLGLSEERPPDEVLAPPLPANFKKENREENPEAKSPMPFTLLPIRRFTDPSERAAFAAAIERVRSELGREYRLIIGGRESPGAAPGELIESVNPARPGEVVGLVAAADARQAQEAIAAAADAFEAWAERPVQERAAVLRRAAQAMRRRRDELAAWEIFEAGKPWREADADVAEAIDYLEYYAAEALRLVPGRMMNVPGEDNAYFYEPRGVGAVIAPWNFPLGIVTGMAAAAIVTGNTVVVKPAPQTPVVAAKLAEAFAQAGLPPGVLNFLPGPDEAGEALVRHPRTHFVAFTGSESVGKRINQIGAEVAPGQDHLKRIIAEMGGKNAIIIDSDADLDDAVRGVAASAFGYAGQKCSAASRVIVVGGLHDAFVRRLVEAAQSLPIGLPEEPATIVGPVIDGAAFERIGRAVEEGKKIARLALAVDASHLRPGYFIGPTIFTDVPPESFMAQEEIFGPVLAVLRAGDFDEALMLANATRYALTGGVYSRSPAHLLAARRRFRVGNLYLNRKITGAVVGRQPFGGFKLSGVGSKAGGPDYLLQFLEPRTVTENTIRRGFAPE